MNGKKCENCGTIIDENLSICPACNNPPEKKEYNISNQFTNINKQIEEENELIKKNDLVENQESKQDDSKSILFYHDKIIEEKIKNATKHNTIKKKKSDNTLFCCLILVQAIILLLIIVFASFIDFNLVYLLHYGFAILTLMISFNFVYRRKDIGYLLTLASAISMIFMICEKDYISAAMGGVFFIASFIFLIKK